MRVHTKGEGEGKSKKLLSFPGNIGRMCNLFASSILGTSLPDSEAFIKRISISFILEKKSLGTAVFSILSSFAVALPETDVNGTTEDVVLKGDKPGEWFFP